MKALQFKVLQRKLKFRNPNHWLEIPADLIFAANDLKAAAKYLQFLDEQEIKYTFPGHPFYPQAFEKMKEPPLFLEYKGEAFWKLSEMISVVGSREITVLTQSWMKTHLASFIESAQTGIVSGGARGVDQLAHFLAVQKQSSTVIVLPSGIGRLYPDNLQNFATPGFEDKVCFLSEFEFDQKIQKAHFYFRNRLIAALGAATLVVQASLKSGSLLTVHHGLENGKPVLVVPSHPEMIGFDGNLKLLREGAYPIQNSQDLLDFWNAEFHYK